MLLTRRQFGGLSLASLVSLAGACGRRERPGVTRPPPPPPARDELVVGRAGDPVGLDPATLFDLDSIQLTESLFDTLVRFGDGTLDVEPALATEWTVGEDGREWTFRLREGVRFHDGSPFDAEAVVYNFERQVDPDSPRRYGQVFAYWPLVWGTPSRIVGVRALDSRTVGFSLSEPVACFLDNLAMPYFALASPTALERHREEAFKHPVGTGPFRFVEWAPGERVVLEPCSRAWEGRPGMDRVVFLPIPDDTSRQLQVEAGRVHLVTQVLVENVEDLRADPAVRVATVPGMNVGFMAVNNRRPPFDQLAVRRAVAHAVNVRALVEGLFRNLARPAGSPLPPPVWGRVDPGPVPYEPEMARRLLQEAGHPDGFACELWYMSVSRPYMPEPRAIAEALQAMLAEVGIRADLRTSDWSHYLDATARGEYDLCLLGWVGDHGDPDNYLFTLFDSQNIDTGVGGSNLLMYSNPRVDRLLEEGRKRLDRARRVPLYREAQAILREDVPWVPLAYADLVVVHHPALQGFRLHPSGALRLKGVRWAR